MLNCYNRGCGQNFDPETNTDESCRHHPGEPFFHDAYKGWSCCNKKSVDFTEFLSIKGCTLSKHSNVKPPEPEKPPQTSDIADLSQEVIEVRAPIRPAMERPAIETPMTVVQAVVAPALKEAIDTRKAKTPQTVNCNQLAAGEVAVGTSCKNAGCTYSYTGTSADESECQYHPGVPIFHEGMKYWSCCQKKTTDFTAFMAQKGCAYAQHKWVKENEDKQVVQCRYDWHQTATDVIVSIYAKMYHYEQSFIEVNPIRLRVRLVFPEQENAKFDIDLELRGVIDVAKTTAQMFGTKVEITLPKAEPGLWPKLDFPREKLPPAKKADSTAVSKQERISESDDGFDLDDIETVKPGGLSLIELDSNNKNNLD